MRQWVLDRWQTYARVCLLAAVFLSPVAFWRGTVDVFNLFKISILLVAGLAAAGLWVAWSAERGVWPPFIRTGIAALAFLAAAALATISSENPALSAVGLYHRYGGLLPFALYGTFMLSIVGLYWERPAELKEVARAAGAASIVMLGYVLIQAAGLDWIDWRDASGGPPPYPVGTMGNSNFAGAYLGIALPSVIFLAVSARGDVMRTVFMSLVGLDLLAIWFTQTRGGMIAAAAGIVVMVAAYRRLLPRWLRVSVGTALVIAALLAVVVVADVGDLHSRGPLSSLDTFRTGTFEVRTFYWGTALRIFRDNPVLGTGLETYYANYPQYRLPEDGRQLGLTITDKPHNIYLEYAANSGLLGLGAYLAVVALGVLFAVRTLRNVEGEARLLLVTFLAVLGGYLAQGFFSIDVPPLAVMGWIALGAIAAIADPAILARRRRLAEEAQKTTRPRAGKRKSKNIAVTTRVDRRGPTIWPVHGVAVVAVSALCILGLRPLFADARAKAGQTKTALKQPSSETLTEYRAAISLHPFEPSYRALAGSIAEGEAKKTKDPPRKIRMLREALAHFRSAYDLQRGNVFFMMNLARVNAALGEAGEAGAFDESDTWWGKVTAHDATDWEVQNRYALFINDWANFLARRVKALDPEGRRSKDPDIVRLTQEEIALRERSVLRLKRVLEIRDDHVSSWVNLGKVYVRLGAASEAREALVKALELDPSNSEARKILSALR